MIFSFIYDHEREYTVTKMCKVMGVSRQGYINWRHRRQNPNTEKMAAHEEITQKIAQSYHLSGGTYGSPRVHEDLLAWGYSISQKTVAILMNKMGLSAIPPTKYMVTTDSNHTELIYPNLVNREFNVTDPNQVWVADITYIWTNEGWLYLASIMDLFSRKIIGWSLDSHMRKELTIEALEIALGSREIKGQLTHHSDRGVQYCSNVYVDLLEQKQIQISMSRKGDPYDNACIESFHATIKKELIYRRRFKTRAEARRAISHYIVSFYNERRRHSTLGYLSPNNFERKSGLLSSEKIS